MTDLQTSYFSFGIGHECTIDGVVYDANGLLKITARDPRAVMIRMFGQRWAFEYSSKDLDDLSPNKRRQYWPRGVIREISEQIEWLVYVDGPWAWFASVLPSDPRVLGDGWNAAPHDCNAGPPYRDRGVDYVKVAFDGELEPCGTLRGDRWGYLSVDLINAGAAPWLAQRLYGQRPMQVEGQINLGVQVSAGVDLATFERLVGETGGRVYR